ncbi:MAG: Bug family tripartite tricarboxylate transporter substrate binding protein [Pigmentiphaga sp.]
MSLVVGFPAGGGTDALARTLADKLTARTGANVIVENRVGASGTIAANYVSKAAPDGSILLVSPVTLLTAPHTMDPNSRGIEDVTKELVPVAQITEGTLVLAVNSNTGIKNIQELVTYLKANPGTAYGTAGNGTPMHIAGELFKNSANVDISHVPYKGSAPMVTDLVAGHIKMGFVDISTARPFLESGRIAAIGALHKERSKMLPDVPTISEQGVPGVELTTWFGVFAPNHTPQSVANKLNREIVAALDSPDVVEKFRNLGEVLVDEDAGSFRKTVLQDYQRYGDIVKQFNIKAQ